MAIYAVETLASLLLDFLHIGSGNEKGFALAYRSGHPERVMPDSEGGQLQAKDKKKPIAYRAADGSGFGLPRDLVRSAEFISDTLVITAGDGDESLGIQFDGSGLSQGLRKRLLKQVLAHLPDA